MPQSFCQTPFAQIFTRTRRLRATAGFRAVVAMSVLLVPAVSESGQSGQPAPAAQSGSGNTRRLSMDDAVNLGLDQNLGIKIERLNPQIQDLSIAQTRSNWAPIFTSSLTNNSQNNPSTSALSGGATKITDSRFATQLGMNQSLKTGANYSVTWDSSRATSTNVFNNFDPLIRSGLALNVSQPLLRNFKIDPVRQQLEVGLRNRDGADFQLQSTIVATTRNVRNAYWDLAYQIASLSAAQQSLDLAQRLLADNQKRVQIGTMAPIDIVEAESEVARNDEAVIVAESAIKQAEDRLRALILDPATPDFWTVSLEPTDTEREFTHDVHGALGAMLARNASLGSDPARHSSQTISRPRLQSGQRSASTPKMRRRASTRDSPGGARSRGGSAPSSLRHCSSIGLRTRLLRRPYRRMRTNPAGNTCRRNDCEKVSAVSFAVLTRLPSLRSR